MRLILSKDVKKVGRAGDIVNVSDGYGRNFLLPRGLARFADENTVQSVQKERLKLKTKEEEQKKQAKKVASELAGKAFTVSAEASPEGRLYAGLKEPELLAMIGKSAVKLPEESGIVDYSPIKQTGEHRLKLSLTRGIETEIVINVINTDAKK